MNADTLDFVDGQEMVSMVGCYPIRQNLPMSNPKRQENHTQNDQP